MEEEGDYKSRTLQTNDNYRYFVVKAKVRNYDKLGLFVLPPSKQNSKNKITTLHKLTTKKFK